MKKLGPSTLLVEMQNGAANFGEVWQFLKILNKIATWPNISLQGICLKEMKTYVHTKLKLLIAVSLLVAKTRKQSPNQPIN